MFNILLKVLLLITFLQGHALAGSFSGGPPVGAKDKETLYKNRLVGLARDDLARRLGIDPQDVELVEIASNVWRDSSLGCPKPGGMYAQVLTQGYRIVVAAQGRRYEYHSDMKHVVYCAPKPH